MPEQNYNGYLIYNWKKNDARLRQTKPGKSETSPHELPVKVNLNVTVPEVDTREISLDLDIPEVQIREAVGDIVEIEDEHDEYPDPKRALVRNDAEDLREFYQGFENEAENIEDIPDLLEYTRRLYATEHSNWKRDEVIEFLEERISDLKRRIEENSSETIED